MNNAFGNQANAAGFKQEYRLLSTSGLPVLDCSYLDEIAGLQQDGEPDLIGNLIQIFVEKTPNSLTTLRLAFVRGNIDAVRKTAHSLKSSSGNMGGVSMSYASNALEKLEPYSNEEAARLIVRIESEFEFLKQVLQNRFREKK